MLGPCPTLKWGWASSDQALDISTLYLLADLALCSSVFLLDLCWRLRFIFISMLPFYSAIYSLSLSSSLFISLHLMQQAYPGSLPGNLLSSGVPQQEYDLPHSSLLATQSMPTKYSTAMSSISGPTVSLPEVLAQTPSVAFPLSWAHPLTGILYLHLYSHLPGVDFSGTCEIK